MPILNFFGSRSKRGLPVKWRWMRRARDSSCGNPWAPWLPQVMPRVRGITCGSHGAQGFPQLESRARRIHRHFTGNPRFERLPKKFKIGIEADVIGGRHLIQDVGLVLAGREEG